MTHMMILTPLILPPDPSTIPTLSPMAQSVLALIREEREVGRGNGSGRKPYRASISTSLRDHPQNFLNTNAPEHSRREPQPPSDSCCADMNNLAFNTSSGSYSRGYGNPPSISYSNTRKFAANSYLPAYSEITPWTNNTPQQIEPIPGYIYPQVQQSQKSNEIFSCRSNPSEPFIEISENLVEAKQPYNLSPDMEFDDMEIYSRPFSEEGEDNIKILKNPLKPEVNLSLKVPVSMTTKNSLNFREIKPRHFQKHGWQMKTTFPPPRPDTERILTPKKIEPSDQTFVFADANTVLKKTTPKFRNSMNKKAMQSNQQIKSNTESAKGTPKSTKNVGKRSFDDDIKENFHHKLSRCVAVEKENFELDDVFDDAFERAVSKLEQSQSGDNFTGSSIRHNFGKSMNNEDSACYVDPADILSAQRDAQTGKDTPSLGMGLTLTTNKKNSNHNSDFSESLFEKTQESDVYGCDQSKVNDKSNIFQSQELSTLPYQPIMPTHVPPNSTISRKSEFSEDLFVNTQEMNVEYKNGCFQGKGNKSNEQNQSEDFPPYQKPFESNDSPDFYVDDLFSLRDVSLKGSLAALKANTESLHNSRTLKTNINELIKNSPDELGKNEILDLKTTTKTNEKSEKEIGPSRNGSNFDDNSVKQMKQDSLKCDQVNSTNNLNFQPLRSIYFQNTERTQNVTFGNQGIVSKNKDKANREKTHSVVKGDTTQIKMAVLKDPMKDMKNLTDIGGGNVTGGFSKKKTSLKQSTLFDCRKFISGIKTKEGSNDIKPTNITQDAKVGEYVELDKFKKPLPPVKKTKTSKVIPNASDVKNCDKLLPSNKLDSRKNNRGINEFLLSNTPLQEIKQKCNPSKIIQTSLIKNEPVKRSSDGTSNPKKSKKSCFIPPIAASHLTSQDSALKNYTITVIDDAAANRVLKRFNEEELTKVVTTVTFKEGYTLLNKPDDQKKNSRCFPSGVMFMIDSGQERGGYYFLPVLDKEVITPLVKTLVDTLMSKSERNICFEAQAVYMLLMDILNFEDISKWNAYDPLIGCWLLDPDNPPKDFLEASGKLDMDRNLLVVNPQANTKNQACDLLPVLDAAMDVLQNRLVNASLWTVFVDMESKLVPMLATMESSSILVDVEKVHRTAEAMDRKLRALQGEAHNLADRWFLLNSPQQLREILFDKLKLDEKFDLKIKKTEHGEKSTSETVLEQLKAYHPLPGIILEYRRLQKLKSTYVEGLIQHVKSDGTIGTSWEQVSAATGRITSKNPNLQAFPKCPISVRNNETINLREMFKAREGCSFLAADFQQIEFRVFAHFTQDKSLLQAFSEGGDIFQKLAEKWLGGKGEEEREKTKRIVYSVMYGAGANKLSEYLHVEPSQAYKIIDNFTAIFPSLRSLPRTVVAQCRVQGYVATLSGRRRLFPNIRSTSGKLRAYSERQAMNFLIQGSAADICKAAMLDCGGELRSRGLRARLLLMIHDELVWEVDDRDLHDTARTVREAMEHRWNERLTLLVPIPVSVAAGKTLADLQPLD